MPTSKGRVFRAEGNGQCKGSEVVIRPARGRKSKEASVLARGRVAGHCRLFGLYFR